MKEVYNPCNVKECPCFELCCVPSTSPICAAIHKKETEKQNKNRRKTGAIFPNDSKERKRRPIMTGVLDYFPDAIAAVAELSVIGNEQHNPGEPLHWARDKSTDQADTAVRHLMERGTFDIDGVRHSTKAAWRALANLQTELEEQE